MKYLVIVISLFVSDSINSQKIFAVAGNSIVSYDIKSKDTNTLVKFSGQIHTNLNFSATIDRFNGFYYLGASIPGRTGEFHKIDVVNGDVQSMDILTGDFEYDPYKYRLIFTANEVFYSLNLETFKNQRLIKIDNSNSLIFGQIRTYVPQKFEYIFTDDLRLNANDPSTIVFNTLTNTIDCEEIDPIPLTKFQCDNISNSVFVLKNNTVGYLDQCSSTFSEIVKLNDFNSHLNNQMSVYNHQNKTYIIPYINNKNQQVLVYVDIENKNISKVEAQPFKGTMNLQQIYDKPDPVMICLNDTLYVPKGKLHTWILNDNTIATTVENYWVPKKSGKYACDVSYKEYSAISNSKEIKVSGTSVKDLSDNSKNIVLDVINDRLNVFVPDISLGSKLIIEIYTINGVLIQRSAIEPISNHNSIELSAQRHDFICVLIRNSNGRIEATEKFIY